MKFQGAFLIIWFVLAAGAASPRSHAAELQTAEEIAKAAADSIVLITQTGRDGSRQAIGTGFVISEDGLIATSLHVIGEGRLLTVSFADGETRPVTAIHAWDRKLDLAVVRVQAGGLPHLRLGDSDTLKQGAAVVAIGNPQGLARSIVQGIVSAIRDFEFGPMIQLAIPIEPGNSGGPLLDMKGRVQGIVNMKSVVTDNLGFAIPINALDPLLKNPNSVPLEKWAAIGALDEKLWEPLMGGDWRQRVGMITVEGSGQGFGGRALCLSRQEVPDAPYELAVTVQLDDEAGAAGLAFAADGGDLHYGFYPSGGQLRLTRFDGPSVFTWNILRQIDAPQYRPGDWNRLKVRIEPEKILCYVNDHLIAEVDEKVARSGRAGLAKFRNTKAKFRKFQLGRSVPSDQSGPALEREKLDELIKSGQIEPPLLTNSPALRAQLLAVARDLDERAASARKLARQVNERAVQQDILSIFEESEDEIDLFAAAFSIARLEGPDLELANYQAELERMTAEVRSRFSGTTTSQDKLEHLRKFLFEESGFHGSRSDYYNRANSFMNQVIDDREGIPITLAVLFLQLGANLGIDRLEGMPFPGHFMVRFTPEGDEPPVYIDVFDGGKTYERSDLYGVVSRHSEVPLREEHFRPATKRDIIVRMLKNIIAVTIQQEVPSRTLPYLDLLLALAPDDPNERWRRATLRLQSGHRAAAGEDLRWMVENKPPGFDLERIEELYHTLRR